MYRYIYRERERERVVFGDIHLMKRITWSYRPPCFKRQTKDKHEPIGQNEIACIYRPTLIQGLPVTNTASD